MTFKNLYILGLLFFNLMFSQTNKEIQVTLMIDNIEINEIEFYLITKNKIDTLKLIDSKLNFEYDSEQEIKMIARMEKRCINFYINPKEMYYLRIEKMPFRLNNFFRRKYVVNQGFDYEEIVKCAKCKIE